MAPPTGSSLSLSLSSSSSSSSSSTSKRNLKLDNDNNNNDNNNNNNNNNTNNNEHDNTEHDQTKHGANLRYSLSERPEISFPILSLVSTIVHITQHLLLRYVTSGTSQIQKLQRKTRQRFLDRYCLIASSCGSENFYVLILPFLFWVADPTLGRLITVLFAINLYIGNFLKNILCLPRPPIGAVWVPAHLGRNILDNRDYGWPSTHCLNGIALPFFVLRYYYGFMWVWEYPSPLVLTGMYTLAFLWSGSIAFSRMYLGVHSPADVQGGTIIGAICLRFFLSVCDSVDLWLVSGRNVAMILHLVSMMLLLVHPQTKPASYTYTETTSMLGVVTGLLCGSWVNSTYMSPQYSLYNGIASWSSLALSFHSSDSTIAFFFAIGVLWKPLLKYILGLVLMIASYEVCKKLINKVVWTVFRGLGIRPDTDDEHSVKKKNDIGLPDVIIRFFSYSIMGWVVTVVAPVIFHELSF